MGSCTSAAKSPNTSSQKPQGDIDNKASAGINQKNDNTVTADNQKHDEIHNQEINQ